YLNDATLWGGEPVDPYMNEDAHNYIKPIRELLRSEDYAGADSLIRQVQGSFSQSYSPLGTLKLNFGHDPTKVVDYRRHLDLNKAIADVSYTHDGTNYNRQYFISHPDSVMVIHLQSSARGQLNFSIDFESLLSYNKTPSGSTLEVDGYAPYICEPHYRFDIKDPVKYDESRGIHFANLISIKDTDGAVTHDGTTLSLSDATHAQILISIETSFNGYDKDPVREGKPYKIIARDQLLRASTLSFDELIEHHLDDYSGLFDRLDFRLQQKDPLSLPTDERLKRYSQGKEDKELEELYFHFGRYLMIASSRTPEVPINLQGIWNPYLQPPWSSNYTTNINVEENYWLAEVANLSECHVPLLSWIKNVATTGAVSAKTFYGARGWSVGHNSDIWAMSNPVGDFGKGSPAWANWTMGGAWLGTHLWEHYLFSQDRTYLQEEAYPLMKGAAQFCVDMMVRDQNAKWVTSPGTSPENIYITPEGYHGATLYGSTSDLALCRETFLNTITAAEILNTDRTFIKELQ
ncbi:MAG: glycoside hydrolase family 95 protein, partial [Bacteroidota bacterium]